MTIKLPWTYSRANAYMRYNELWTRERVKVKRQARKELRRYLKRELINNISEVINE